MINKAGSGTYTLYRDSTPPTGTVEINDGATVTSSRRVRLDLDATDLDTGVAEMRISTDLRLDTEPWVPYRRNSLKVLPPGDGLKTVTVQVRNHAGGASRIMRDAIRLDTSPPTAANGRIAFRAGTDIWTMNPDGSDRQNITNSPDSTERWPTWSPDGTQLAFTSDQDGSSDVWVMNADGSNARNVTNHADHVLGKPAWSPDGNQIAFQRDGTGGRDIWVMNADGTGQRNLTGTPGSIDSYPSWSPDGTQISFHSDRDNGTDGIDIFVMDADGTNVENLTDSPPSRDLLPAWSPEGEQLVFLTNRAGGNHVFALDPDGTNVRDLGLGVESS